MPGFDTPWARAAAYQTDRALGLCPQFGRGCGLLLLLIRLRPGGRSGKHPYAHPSEEVAFVAQGEVRLTLGPEEHRLRRGDAVTILAGELRLWRNCTRAPARILIASTTSGRAIASGPGRRRAASAR